MSLNLNPEYIERQLRRLAHPDQVQEATYRLLSHLQESRSSIRGMKPAGIAPRIYQFLALDLKFSEAEVAAIASVAIQAIPGFEDVDYGIRKQFIRLQATPQESAQILAFFMESVGIQIPTIPSLRDRLVSHEDGEIFSPSELAAVIAAAVSSYA